MTRTSLDDAQWTSLIEAALRRCIEAVLWILRTGAPWRDLPETLGHWPSVYHRWRRWCVRGWCNLIFEHLRPMVPADGLVLADSTTCKAHRSASGAAHSSAEAESLGRSRGGICSKIHPFQGDAVSPVLSDDGSINKVWIGMAGCFGLVCAACTGERDGANGLGTCAFT